MCFYFLCVLFVACRYVILSMPDERWNISPCLDFSLVHRDVVELLIQAFGLLDFGGKKISWPTSGPQMAPEQNTNPILSIYMKNIKDYALEQWSSKWGL